MFGLNLLDAMVIIAYFAGLIVIGLIVSKRIKSEDDFLVGGRGIGRLLQTFMNFGMATSVDAPVGTSRESFRQGMAGIWLQLFTLFATPFYWITTIWQRRLRISSMGDFYKIRFANPPMEMFFAFIGILGLVAMISIGMVSLEKTVEILMPKAEEQLTVAEKQMIENFNKMKLLDNAMQERALTEQELQDYDELKLLKVEGKVKSSIPAINPELLLYVMAAILLIYTLAGGIIAAAITDFFQGILMIVLSFLLLPFALIKVGGFSGLHAKVPDSFFKIFDSSAASEYPWYYIFTLVILGLIVTESSPHNMQIFGSAKDEEAARFGRVSGLFLKRFTVIMWGFTGVVGYALYRNDIADPDMLWGYMTRQLLMPGLIGLMLVCLLAALQSSVSAFMVATGALFTRNIYQPFFPQRSDKEYIFVSRIASAAVLVVSVYITLYFNNFLSILRFAWAIGLVFGPVFWMAIMWRHLTTSAAWAAILYSFVLTLFFGNFSESITPIAQCQYLCRRTNAYVITEQTRAVQEDVDEGRAAQLGAMIQKDRQIPSVGILFEEVVKLDPDNPDSPWVGKKRFRAGLLLPYLFGVDFSNFKKADIITLGYVFDISIPFIIMWIISFFTRRNDKDLLDKFYCRLQTPVRGTLEEDQKEIELSFQNPQRFKHNKIFPNSSIEMIKLSKRDWWGFVAVSGVVGLIILFLVTLAKLGA